MNQSADVVLKLLKVALGNSRSVDYSSSKVNWKEVIEFATRQGVLGVCFDAFESLSDLGSKGDKVSSCLPDLDNLMTWLGQTSYMETQYEQYVETIHKFASFLGQQNLQVMLMKGYGCSLNYPVPNHRPCGDIDIWLYGKQKKADELMLSKGIEINYDNEHHSVFPFDDFIVENHQTIMDANSHMSNGYINHILDQLALESVENGKEVFGAILPSAKFNSIHLLRHMASDFATVKTTLRHVLDWSTFIANARTVPDDVYVSSVDWDFVYEVAHNAKMNRFLDAINGICVGYLGYPSEIFPIEFRDERLEKRVLDEILTCEDVVDAPVGKLAFVDQVRYGIRKTARMWRNRWKYEIVYDESILDSFIWKARNRWMSQNKICN